MGAPQLVASGQIDYLVFDYLAELTMSILAAARQKNAALGYATDFVTVAMRAVLKDVVQRGIRVVSNAGGVNPQACATALQTLAEELGVNVKIAVVTGDDAMPLIPTLREAKVVVPSLCFIGLANVLVAGVGVEPHGPGGRQGLDPGAQPVGPALRPRPSPVALDAQRP